MDMYKIYELLPQMKTYSELGHEWKPFIMNTQESKFRSNVVNTDNFGLRFNDQKISNSIFDKKDILKEKTFYPYIYIKLKINKFLLKYFNLTIYFR